MKNKMILIFSNFAKVIASGVLFFALGVQPVHALEKITYYHNDGLGSPVAGTDEAGALLWKEDYKPYGERIRKQVDSESNTRWFTGHPEDKETGFIYAGARHYDPVVGRFMGIDSIGFTEDNFRMFNRYAYANNNPFRFTDPDGNEAAEKTPGQLQLQEAHDLGNEIADVLSVTLDEGYKFFFGGVVFKVFGRGLKFSSSRAPALRNTKDRLNFRGDPNSIIRGTDVARKGGGKRVFITDENGRIIREITPQRVKVRRTNKLPDGSTRDTFRKTGKPTPDDLRILNRV